MQWFRFEHLRLQQVYVSKEFYPLVQLYSIYQMFSGLQMSLCKEDEQCGGLRGACNNGLCDCYAAFAKHGYNDVLDAWSKLCNAKQCNKKTAALDCFGLPCNKGFCTC